MSFTEFQFEVKDIFLFFKIIVFELEDATKKWMSVLMVLHVSQMFLERGNDETRLLIEHPNQFWTLLRGRYILTGVAIFI